MQNLKAVAVTLRLSCSLRNLPCCGQTGRELTREVSLYTALRDSMAVALAAST